MRRRQTFNFNNGKWFYVILGLCFISALTLAGVNMYYSSPAPSDGSYVDLSQLDTKEKESTETEKKETEKKETAAEQVKANSYKEEDMMFGLDNVMDATDEVSDDIMVQRRAEADAKEPGEDKVQEEEEKKEGTEVSKQEEDAANKDQSQEEKEQEERDKVATMAAGGQKDFAEGTTLKWPIAGNVVLRYSMDQTIYFPTLKQYKYNPGILISGEIDMPVVASHRGEVIGVSHNEELGNYIQIDVGNGFTTVYGQLKDIPWEEGQIVDEGVVLGYIEQPTKYYSSEGAHVFFEMRKGENPINPLDYLE